MSLFLTLNRVHLFSGVSIVHFVQVNADCESTNLRGIFDGKYPLQQFFYKICQQILWKHGCLGKLATNYLKTINNIY